MSNHDFVEALENLYASPEKCAQAAGLSYTSLDEPGYERRPYGKGFTYLDDHGQRVTNTQLRSWFKSLAIPPAWTNVWICKSQQSHVLAAGEDAAGRRQYIYHDAWRNFRDTLNQYRLIIFGHNLSAIRSFYRHQLEQSQLSPTKLIAAVIHLLDTTALRIGNELSTTLHNTYGATTLPQDAVTLTSKKVILNFTGKSGKEHEVVITHKYLVEAIHDLVEEDTAELFSYHDSVKQLISVSAQQVNQTLQSVTDSQISAKDFRTWKATVIAFEQGLKQLEQTTDPQLGPIYQHAAQALGNTTGMVRDHYIHKHVLTAIKEGTLADLVSQAPQPAKKTHLKKTEHQLLGVLEVLAQKNLSL